MATLDGKVWGAQAAQHRALLLVCALCVLNLCSWVACFGRAYFSWGFGLPPRDSPTHCNALPLALCTSTATRSPPFTPSTPLPRPSRARTPPMTCRLALTQIPPGCAEPCNTARPTNRANPAAPRRRPPPRCAVANVLDAVRLYDPGGAPGGPGEAAGCRGICACHPRCNGCHRRTIRRPCTKERVASERSTDA